MKILSTILYKEDAVIAMIAGTAYCIKSLPILSVPNAVGVFCPAILYTYFFLAGAKVLFFKTEQQKKHLKPAHYADDLCYLCDSMINHKI